MSEEILNAETEVPENQPADDLSEAIAPETEPVVLPAEPAAEPEEESKVLPVVETEEESKVLPAVETEEEPEEEGEIDAGVLGENIDGEFSFNSAAKEMGKVMRVPDKVISYIVSFVYLIVGALCVALRHHIEAYLPYIVGSLMAAFAVAQFILAVVRKEFENPHSNRTASSLIILALSIFILVESEWGHTFIPVLWGLFGLYEGAHAFNHAMSRIARGLNPAYFIIKGIVEVVVAFLLLYKPEEYGELHIIVFGISLIFDGITHMPPIKKLLTRR